MQVVQKKEPPLPAKVEEVDQAKSVEEPIRQVNELKFTVRGISPPPLPPLLFTIRCVESRPHLAPTKEVQVGTSFVYNTLDLEDICLSDLG